MGDTYIYMYLDRARGRERERERAREREVQDAGGCELRSAPRASMGKSSRISDALYAEL